MKCPFCDNNVAYLCDNVSDPLEPRYYCDKCDTVFTKGGMMVGTKPKVVRTGDNQDRIDELEKKIDEHDQTAKADAGKPKLTLVPRQIIYDIAEVREYGNNKYPEGGPDNWKKVSPERYRDAAYRHWLAYLEDPESVDEESGIKHLKHLACNIAFLCEFDKMEELMTFYDNHPYCTIKEGED